jgi:hypothetical protein
MPVEEAVRAAPRRPRAALASALCLFCIACSAELPQPRLVGQPTDALVAVGFPPPPARAEEVPTRPAADAVWIDGEWLWQRGKWAWHGGRWVVPPQGAAYSPWTVTRGKDGTVFFAGGAWRDAAGKQLEEPAPLAVAKPSTGTVIDPDGKVEDTGRVSSLPPTPGPPSGDAKRAATPSRP